MRPRRRVPTQQVKLGRDTVTMLRDIVKRSANAKLPLDQAIWLMAERFRQFVQLRVKDRSTDAIGIPKDVSDRYGVPHDRTVYQAGLNGSGNGIPDGTAE